MSERSRRVCGFPVEARRDPIGRPSIVPLAVLITIALFGSGAGAQQNDLAAAQRLTRQIEKLQDANDYVTAIPLAEQAVAIFERLLDVKSLESEAARGRLAVLYVLAGEFEQAEVLLRRMVEEGSLRGPIGGRGFLYADEPKGYGLYSYLLFKAPPRDEAERARYLQALEAHIMLLPPMVELERHRLKSQVNATLVPVQALPKIDKLPVAQAAAQVLLVYDYARANVLLDDLGVDVAPSGPYLLARMPGLPDKTRLRLLFDMSHIEPRLAWDWTRTFNWCAAQERSWSEVALRKLELNVRNVIAKGAAATGDVVLALQEWIRLVRSK